MNFFVDDARGWAMRQTVGSMGERFTLLLLAMASTQSGHAEGWSVRELARVMLAGERSVRLWLQKLERRGYITRIPDMSGTNGAQLANIYRLNMTPGESPVLTPPASDAAPPGISGIPSSSVTSTSLSQGRESRGAREKKVSTRRDDFENLKLGVFEIYNELRPAHWVEHRVFPRECERHLRMALDYANGDHEEALAVIHDSLTYASQDTFFWNNPNKSAGITLANILNSGRVITFAEKLRTERRVEEEKLAGPVNPAKVRELSVKYGGVRDATEEEWRMADQDSKVRFLREGRVYRHDDTEVLLLRKGPVNNLVRFPGGIEAHVSIEQLGRESREQREGEFREMAQGRGEKGAFIPRLEEVVGDDGDGA